EMDAIARDADRIWHSNKDGAFDAEPNATKRPAKKTAAKPDLEPGDIAGAKQAKLPATLSPQLAKLADQPPPGDDWLHEIKFDGYRILAHLDRGTVRLLSRNDLDWTAKFPELAKALADLPVDSAVLDGEVVHVTDSGVTSFSALQDDLSTGRT